MRLKGLPIITRFDLRQRGALAVMLKGPEAGQSWVGRVCSHPEVVAHLASNENTVRRLLAATADNPAIFHYLPKPIERLDIDGAVMWLEERLPGTVAWRLPGTLRSAVDAGWMQFLARLSTTAAAEVRLDEQRAKEFVGRAGNNIRASSEELAREVLILEDWIERKITNKPILLGWAHGDFGYGNLLADPVSGELQAVIDWETGRDDEMAGVDWMNMLLVSERTGGQGNLVTAVRNVALRMNVCSAADRTACGLSAFLAGTASHPHGADVLLGLALLRVIQREARYPGLLAAGSREFLAALRTFRQMTDKGCQ